MPENNFASPPAQGGGFGVPKSGGFGLSQGGGFGVPPSGGSGAAPPSQPAPPTASPAQPSAAAPSTTATAPAPAPAPVGGLDTGDFNALLEFACKHNATDLHIGVGSRPVMRVGSVLDAIPDTEVVLPKTAEAHVRSLVDEKQMEALLSLGEIDFSFSRSGLGRFRANVYKQRNTFGIAIRSLPFNIPPFDSLGLPGVIKSFAKRGKGLVLSTGSTGSGKTTTLASIIDIINSERKCHIITIEDPIEYLHRHKSSLVGQREIGSDTRSFSNALRAALREDPDVIMVGEMRDVETISIALTAAETGHLVFSTLHTVGSAKTIDRIIDVFPPNQQNQVKSQLATVLEGVISQQMIPKRDGAGVVVACEVMVVNNAIRNLIREGKPFQINSIIQTSTNVGMQTMEASLAELVTSGLITQDDAILRASDTQLLMQLLNRRY
ncbi:MAG: type IV pilus twitching motility protein PilT [Clostridiales bacterium]|jgi:twitching motility protein PilT|nr:type IV pilus twitching motility protein PilT [Clostridiales bacterium]